LAEPRLSRWPALLERILALADDPQPRVRFQVAFTLGETTDPRAIESLAAIAARDVDEPWIRTAVLSSSSERADRLATALLARDGFLKQAGSAAWLEQLATIVGARNQDVEIARLLDAAATQQGAPSAVAAVVLGLGAGLQRASGTLETARASASGPSVA